LIGLVSDATVVDVLAAGCASPEPGFRSADEAGLEMLRALRSRDFSLMRHVTRTSWGSGGRHVRRNAAVDQTDRRSIVATYLLGLALGLESLRSNSATCSRKIRRTSSIGSGSA